MVYALRRETPMFPGSRDMPKYAGVSPPKVGGSNPPPPQPILIKIDLNRDPTEITRDKNLSIVQLLDGTAPLQLPDRFLSKSGLSQYLIGMLS